MKHTIIFLHGTLCQPQVFAQQIATLQAQQYDCISIDYHDAASLSEMASRALQQTANKPFSIVAFSMGAMVAFELYRVVPEQIVSMVLVAGNAHADLPGRAELREEHLTQAQSTGLESLISELYMPNYLHQQDPSHQQCIVDMALCCGTEVFSSQLQVLANRPDSSELLKEIKQACLIVGAEHDPLCPLTEQYRMYGLLPNPSNELKIVKNCGHFIPLEAADWLSDTLTSWFNQHA